MTKMRKYLLFLACLACAAQDTHWPSFRGPNASGVADGYPAPVSWNIEKSENVRWKTAIPGLGHSSPVIWGDRIFVTTAVDEKKDSSLKVGLYGNIEPVTDDAAQAWKLLCLDRKSGRILWERTAHSGVPKIKRHPKSTHANPTPATNGRQVIAFFGAEGLYAYDFDGKLLWKKDLGVLDSGFFVAPEAQWGFASSPVIHDDLVIVQCDVLTKPFLAAFRLKDGSEAWRTPRTDVPAWSTPTVADGEKAQIIVNGFKHIGGYDARTGREIWKLRGGGDIPTPTPVLGHGLAFITNAHGGMSPIYAVRLTATGDISLKEGERSNWHVAWSQPREGAYMPTPVVYGDYLYMGRDNGVLSCYRAVTGERLYQERLGKGGGFSASLVAADGKVYVSSEEGDVFVVQAGPEFRLLATNSMDDLTMATPAISEGTLYFRTRRSLIAIGGK
ncbi:MAG: PQQ-like beta-propeller repeat protein [Bryobacteraceae bacterium]|nr:PQQ-like beta-propeller repeat protein [Bryobacteraceae bacterium]